MRGLHRSVSALALGLILAAVVACAPVPPVRSEPPVTEAPVPVQPSPSPEPSPTSERPSPSTQWPHLEDLGEGGLPEDLADITATLELTATAQQLLAATQPVLTAEQDVLMSGCQSATTPLPGGSLLGCFASDGRTAGRIYAYRVDHPELSGTNELTLSHELLHAVWHHMATSDREALEPVLEEIFRQGQPPDRFNVLTAYRDTDHRVFIDELHSYIGTEVRSLPAVLEDHYSTVFSNRTRIVEFAEEATRSLKARTDDLESRSTQLETMGATIEAERAALNELGATRRTQQAELDTLRDQLDRHNRDAIDEYNSRVEQYNADIADDERRREAFNEDVAAYNAAAAERDRLVEELDELIALIGVPWE